MNKAGTKTDNSYLDHKVFLRQSNLPVKNDVKVLDCFAGKSLIWNCVKLKTNKNITVVGIDKKPSGVTIKGDNLKYLLSMDLNNFDIIDLDAYGIPFKQLKLIFMSGYIGIIFVTFIQSMFGGLPKTMLHDIGYPKSMIDKCPTLFYKNGLDKFKQWLSLNGIRKIKRISIDNKHYIFFKKGIK